MTTQTEIQHLTDETFDEALAREGLLVVDFWAAWCGPCRAMAPQLEKAAALRPAHRFAKVDVDSEQRVAAAYGIRSIPTLMVFRDGQPVAAQAGVIPADALVEALDRLAQASKDAPASDSAAVGQSASASGSAAVGESAAVGAA